MASDSTKVYSEKMEGALRHLTRELGAIRAGRANPAVLDKVQVDYYGTPTPINQVAAVAVAEARILTISPWDPALMREIEKAILTSDIGINPTNDGKLMRLVFPSPTEERRKQLGKDVMKLGEDAKVAVRNIRRDAMEDFKAQKKKSEITEDDLKDLENEIQKITDKYTKEIDKMCETKNKEIMEL
ncbi:MAG: ribosome recycling factor [Ruminococcaceae bacterium]|nr:ribosome recycling factor [Oscillospiraceae bacterium]